MYSKMTPPKSMHNNKNRSQAEKKIKGKKVTIH